MTVDMKRRVTIGVVILVVGIVLVSAGAIGEISSLTVTRVSRNPPRGIRFYGIMLNTTSYLAVNLRPHPEESSPPRTSTW